MPGGHTHLILNLIAYTGAVAQVAHSGGLPNWLTTDAAILVSAGYIFDSLFCTPDLDVPEGSMNQYRARKRFGWFGTIYSAYWEDYARFRLFGREIRHRGISHVPILGTLTRWLYLLFPYGYFFKRRMPSQYGYAAKLAGLLIPIGIWFSLLNLSLPWMGIAYLFAGFAVADIVHEIADYVVTFLKGERHAHHAKNGKTYWHSHPRDSEHNHGW